jgi:hypothetical protein
MTDDEWRIEVYFEDDEHHFTLGERLKALDLDDEARRRLGGSVTVTRDGARMFLYASSEGAAREAERVVNELLAGEGIDASVRITRWHPVEEAWRDASEPLPQTEKELEAERVRREQAEVVEAVEQGEYDWEVHIDPPRLDDAIELERKLKREGLPVERLWKYVSVGALTEERAEEIAERQRAEAPDGTEISIAANELPLPPFVFFGAALSRLRGGG